MITADDSLQGQLDRLTTDWGFKNYTTPYYLLLDEALGEQDTGPTEPEFMSRMNKGPNAKAEALKLAMKPMGDGLRESFRILALIATPAPDGGTANRGLTELRAYHDYMFKTLYHLGINCRTLFEAAPDFGRFKDISEYQTYLEKKYNLSAAACDALSLKWVEDYGFTCQSILVYNHKIRVFVAEEVLFQLYNKDLEAAIVKIHGSLLSHNDTIISKYYFMVRILLILAHLELMAKITALEMGQTLAADEMEYEELAEMDTFVATAKTFIKRL
jgi:hypothetical protein